MITIPRSELEEIVERLKEGSTTLAQEARSRGLKYDDAIRGGLKSLLGADGYVELMQSKRAVVKEAVTDEGVPVITSKELKNWDVEQIVVHGWHEDVFINNETEERFVRAAASERADLIVTFSRRGLAPMRLRQEHGSRLSRRHKKEQEAVEERAEVKKKKSTTKRKEEV